MHTNMRGNGNQTKGAEELRMPFKELERMRFTATVLVSNTIVHKILMVKVPSKCLF